MVDINEFGICNYRLAIKVMSSGKCQCRPKDPCPCPEWLNSMTCRCGVFWELNKAELSKNEEKIVKVIIDKLKLMLENNKRAKSGEIKNNGIQEPKEGVS